MVSLFSIKDCISSTVRRNKIAKSRYMSIENIMRIFKEVKSWGFNVHVPDLNSEFSDLGLTFRKSDLQMVAQYEQYFDSWFLPQSDKVNPDILEMMQNSMSVAWSSRSTSSNMSANAHSSTKPISSTKPQQTERKIEIKPDRGESVRVISRKTKDAGQALLESRASAADSKSERAVKSNTSLSSTRPAVTSVVPVSPTYARAASKLASPLSSASSTLSTAPSSSFSSLSVSASGSLAQIKAQNGTNSMAHAARGLTHVPTNSNANAVYHEAAKAPISTSNRVFTHAPDHIIVNASSTVSNNTSSTLSFKTPTNTQVNASIKVSVQVSEQAKANGWANTSNKEATNAVLSSDHSVLAHNASSHTVAASNVAKLKDDVIAGAQIVGAQTVVKSAQPSSQSLCQNSVQIAKAAQANAAAQSLAHSSTQNSDKFSGAEQPSQTRITASPKANDSQILDESNALLAEFDSLLELVDGSLDSAEDLQLLKPDLLELASKYKALKAQWHDLGEFKNLPNFAAINETLAFITEYQDEIQEKINGAVDKLSKASQPTVIENVGKYSATENQALKASQVSPVAHVASVSRENAEAESVSAAVTSKPQTLGTVQSRMQVQSANSAHVTVASEKVMVSVEANEVHEANESKNLAVNTQSTSTNQVASQASVAKPNVSAPVVIASSSSASLASSPAAANLSVDSPSASQTSQTIAHSKSTTANETEQPAADKPVQSVQDGAQVDKDNNPQKQEAPLKHNGIAYDPQYVQQVVSGPLSQRLANYAYKSHELTRQQTANQDLQQQNYELQNILADYQALLDELKQQYNQAQQALKQEQDEHQLALLQSNNKLAALTKRNTQLEQAYAKLNVDPELLLKTLDENHKLQEQVQQANYFGELTYNLNGDLQQRLRQQIQSTLALAQINDSQALAYQIQQSEGHQIKNSKESQVSAQHTMQSQQNMQFQLAMAALGQIPVMQTPYSGCVYLRLYGSERLIALDLERLAHLEFGASGNLAIPAGQEVSSRVSSRISSTVGSSISSSINASTSSSNGSIQSGAINNTKPKGKGNQATGLEGLELSQNEPRNLLLDDTQDEYGEQTAVKQRRGKVDKAAQKVQDEIVSLEQIAFTDLALQAARAHFTAYTGNVTGNAPTPVSSSASKHTPELSNLSDTEPVMLLSYAEMLHHLSSNLQSLGWAAGSAIEIAQVMTTCWLKGIPLVSGVDTQLLAQAALSLCGNPKLSAVHLQNQLSYTVWQLNLEQCSPEQMARTLSLINTPILVVSGACETFSGYIFKTFLHQLKSFTQFKLVLFDADGISRESLGSLWWDNAFYIDAAWNKAQLPKLSRLSELAVGCVLIKLDPSDYSLKFNQSSASTKWLDSISGNAENFKLRHFMTVNHLKSLSSVYNHLFWLQVWGQAYAAGKLQQLKTLSEGWRLDWNVLLQPHNLPESHDNKVDTM